VRVQDIRRDLIIRVYIQSKVESDEPLHLCISSKYHDKYKYACNLVEELINGVYDEYKGFCSKTNKIPVSRLAIKKDESITSRKNTKNEILD